MVKRSVGFLSWASLMGTAVLTLLTLLLALPVLSIVVSYLNWNPARATILYEMAHTVLPKYFLTSVLLCVLVGLGTACVGMGAAALVSLYSFRGRSVLEWALLLPLAMPAYVVAYAYTDFLQFSGPLQTALRASFGLEGRLFPEIRTVWGAAWVLTFTLYPYVYLLTRSALLEHAARLIEAANLLGAGSWRALSRIALPLARPSIAAGVALALMETLADYGVSSYFGIQTFTTGIYKAWLVLEDPIAASQLAGLLLILVATLVALERSQQSKRRYSMQRSGHKPNQALPLTGPAALFMVLLCCLPILFGFVLPLCFMLRPMLSEWPLLSFEPFGQWALNSLRLSALAALLALALAFVFSFALRIQNHLGHRILVKLVGLGYAVPGAVVVVGLLLPVAAVQNRFPDWGLGFWLTSSILGIVWAYLVRFTSVAMQSVESGYSRIPPSLDEQNTLLGRGRWALARQIHLPLLRKAGLAAAILVFVDVMKELPATLVLRPFNSDTLAVVTYQLARDERLAEAGLPALALVLVGLLPVIILSRAMRESHH